MRSQNRLNHKGQYRVGKDRSTLMLGKAVRIFGISEVQLARILHVSVADARDIMNQKKIIHRGTPTAQHIAMFLRVFRDAYQKWDRKRDRMRAWLRRRLDDGQTIVEMMESREGMKRAISLLQQERAVA